MQRIILRCAQCGTVLDSLDEQEPFKILSIWIDPCSKCMQAEYDDGFDAARNISSDEEADEEDIDPHVRYVEKDLVDPEEDALWYTGT